MVWNISGKLPSFLTLSFAISSLLSLCVDAHLYLHKLQSQTPANQDFSAQTGHLWRAMISIIFFIVCYNHVKELPQMSFFAVLWMRKLKQRNKMTCLRGSGEVLKRTHVLSWSLSFFKQVTLNKWNEFYVKSNSRWNLAAIALSTKKWCFQTNIETWYIPRLIYSTLQVWNTNPWRNGWTLIPLI